MCIIDLYLNKLSIIGLYLDNNVYKRTLYLDNDVYKWNTYIYIIMCIKKYI